MTVTSHLQRTRESYLPPEPVKDQPSLLQPCFQPGFTEPAPLDAAGALLPHPCTLTDAIATESKTPWGDRIEAVCFCGTILTIARTGR